MNVPKKNVESEKQYFKVLFAETRIPMATASVAMTWVDVVQRSMEERAPQVEGAKKALEVWGNEAQMEDNMRMEGVVQKEVKKLERMEETKKTKMEVGKMMASKTAFEG